MTTGGTVNSTQEAAKKLNGAESSRRIWDYLTRIAAALTLIVGAALINHQVRLSWIEGNRFTAKDGTKMEKEIKRWIEDRFPQNWLLEDVREIKQMVRENGKAIQVHIVEHKKQ